MKKTLAFLALAVLTAMPAWSAPNVINPGYAGGISISTGVHRSHGGSLLRFLGLGPGTHAAPAATNGAHHLEDTAFGGPSSLDGTGGDMGDFLAIFEVDDITSTMGIGASVLDIPAGKRIVGLFFGVHDNIVTTDGGPADDGVDAQVVLQSTGGRMEFYLIDDGPTNSFLAAGLGGASFDGAGNLTYTGVNDGGTTHEDLFAFDFVAGELALGDLPLLDGLGGGGETVDAATTELRAINTSPGSNSNNNGSYYARIDKSFGSLALANRFDNGGFGLTGNADFSGDYTMNPTIPLGSGANDFSLQFNDPTLATVTAIPEPSTILLLGTGLVGLVAYRRRRA